MWGLYKGPVGTGFVGSVFVETSFYREDEEDRHVAKRSSDPG